MLAAFEATMRRNAKDEAEWKRTYAMLSAEPPEHRKKRRAAGAGPSPSGMTVADAEAMMARFAAADALYGSG